MSTGYAGSFVEKSRNSSAGKVLIVEEDAILLADYALILEHEGYEVKACASYSDGAQSLESTVFSCVLLSQGSQAFEGQGVLKRAIEIDRKTPVVVITRSITMHCYLDAMQWGAVDYVARPQASAEIREIVKAHLRPLARGAVA